MLFGQGKKLCQRAHRRKGKKRPRKGEGRVLRSPQQEIEACQGGLELASDFLQIGLGSHRFYPGFDNLELGNVSFLKKFLSRPSQLLSGLDKSRSDPVSLLRQSARRLRSRAVSPPPVRMMPIWANNKSSRPSNNTRPSLSNWVRRSITLLTPRWFAAVNRVT